MNKYLMGCLIVSLAGCGKYITQEEIDARVQTYKCQPTNEFVGKDAERLYLCRNGVKYKYWSLYVQALDELRSEG